KPKATPQEQPRSTARPQTSSRNSAAPSTETDAAPQPGKPQAPAKLSPALRPELLQPGLYSPGGDMSYSGLHSPARRVHRSRNGTGRPRAAQRTVSTNGRDRDAAAASLGQAPSDRRRRRLPGSAL